MPIRNLPEETIQEIRRLLNDGVRQVDVAKQFGITQSEVSLIKTGRAHKPNPRLYITGVSQQTKKVIVNIAANKNMKIREYLKYEILKLVEATPENLKRPPLPD